MQKTIKINLFIIAFVISIVTLVSIILIANEIYKIRDDYRRESFAEGFSQGAFKGAQALKFLQEMPNRATGVDSTGKKVIMPTDIVREAVALHNLEKRSASAKAEK